MKTLKALEKTMSIAGIISGVMFLLFTISIGILIELNLSPKIKVPKVYGDICAIGMMTCLGLLVWSGITLFEISSKISKRKSIEFRRKLYGE